MQYLVQYPNFHLDHRKYPTTFFGLEGYCDADLGNSSSRQSKTGHLFRYCVAPVLRLFIGNLNSRRRLRCPRPRRSTTSTLHLRRRWRSSNFARFSSARALHFRPRVRGILPFMLRMEQRNQRYRRMRTRKAYRHPETLCARCDPEWSPSPDPSGYVA